MVLELPAGSRLAGETLAESRLGDAFDLVVLGIERGGSCWSRWRCCRWPGRSIPDGRFARRRPLCRAAVAQRRQV